VTATDLLAGIAILVGLVGIVVPVLPGTLLILVAVLVWAALVGGTTAWAVAAVASLLLVVGGVVKYTVPGRRLKTAGVPNSTIVVGGLLGIVGFFAIPVVGLFVGFIGGVYLAELRRLGHPQAWPSTVAALKATGLSILIELAAGLLAASVFVGGVAAT
jgi:uncharacterized protein YqgC (DUF456 family)